MLLCLVLMTCVKGEFQMFFFSLFKWFSMKNGIYSYLICKRPSLSLFLYVLMFILSCFFYGCLDRDVSKDVAAPVVVDKKVEKDKFDEDFYYSDAIEMSKKFVIQSFDTTLQTVKFSTFIADVAKLSDNSFSVKSYVDLQKNCGGVVRKHFICTLKFEKGEWKLKDLEFYWPRLEME